MVLRGADGIKKLAALHVTSISARQAHNFIAAL
jgi:hypothetical protein